VELGAQGSNQSALSQLAFAPSAVPVEEDNSEIVSQDLVGAVDEYMVMGGEKEEAIQQSPIVASTTALVKRPLGRPRKQPIQEPVSLQRTTRRSTSRTKTGCFTCRGRKIKCDEAKPSCESF
jgi:hypothetical protein